MRMKRERGELCLLEKENSLMLMVIVVVFISKGEGLLMIIVHICRLPPALVLR